MWYWGEWRRVGFYIYKLEFIDKIWIFYICFLLFLIWNLWWREEKVGIFYYRVVRRREILGVKGVIGLGVVLYY